MTRARQEEQVRVRRRDDSRSWSDVAVSPGTQVVSEAGKGENRFFISLEPPEGTGPVDTLL